MPRNGREKKAVIDEITQYKKNERFELIGSPVIHTRTRLRSTKKTRARDIGIISGNTRPRGHKTITFQNGDVENFDSSTANSMMIGAIARNKRYEARVRPALMNFNS